MHAAVLRYFREVARRGSIRKAAQTLNVAASAVNRQLLKLEAEIGTPVFDRLPGRMRLTLAGELLLHHVDDTLAAFDRVRSEIDGLRGMMTGHIAIAAVDSLLIEFVPRVIEGFRPDFPAVTYSVIANAPGDIATEVAAGRADIGLTFVAAPPPGAQFTTTIAAPIGVIMPARHPLARRRTISFAEARKYPSLTQFGGPLPITSDLDPEFTRFRESLTPRMVSNSIQMLKQALRQEMGIAFFTRLGFLREIAEGEIAWRPLASRRINALKLGVLVPKGRALPFAALKFADRLSSELKALETRG
jgi:DNA-binding transcriptional LysR family regulator